MQQPGLGKPNFPAREQKIEEALKRRIDGHSFAGAINVLAEMCYQKAEHIEANWQDKMLARLWRREGQRLEGCAGRVQRLVASCRGDEP